MNKLTKALILVLILYLAVAFRFYNPSWDQGNHLHPDERFLTMVGNAMEMPKSFAEYFDPSLSRFNPANIGYNFYVYGTFPVILNKLLAINIGADNYNGFTLLGRQLSALFDVLIVLLIFKSVRIFEREYKYPPTLKYFAAFFYAIAVLPIQLSHFFAVDTFLNFFVFASFYAMLRFYAKNSALSLFFSALSLGLAIASKVSAVFIVPLLLFFFILYFKKRLPEDYKRRKKEIAIDIALCIFIFTLTAYTTVRVAAPYYFETGNFSSAKISNLFIENIKQLKSWEGKDVLFPPSIQWINKPTLITSLKDISLFGLGLPYFIVMLFGFYLVFSKKRRLGVVAVAIWTLLFFLYQSTQFVKAMRYFFIIYPFIAIFAAIGFQAAYDRMRTPARVLILLLLLSWPLAYLSIYIHTNSRVEASYWIYKNLPPGAAIASEEWDDALPMGIYNTNKQFTIESLPVFAPDSPEKWQKMDEILRKRDYYILSSNRAWGSMPTVPERYPQTTKFYQELFAGKRGFSKIKEFTSYPSLTYLGIPFTFPDDFADESFTVYDHPKVIIMKNQSR